MSAVTLWRSDALGGVPHGFAGRRGGVSTGALASLNCGTGSGEDVAIIAVNRRRAADAVMPGADLCGVYQVHGALCVTLDAPWVEADRPQADAIVTRRRGQLLAILTADCAPVLFADAEAGVVGAAHAGWRGALAGVTDATIAAMERLGADRARIAAAVGPCIAQPSYEVDATLFDAFTADDPASERWFRDAAPGHWQFDLEGYVAARVAAAGVARVECLGRDTYVAVDDFYSYRRATHRGEPAYGRQLSMIGVGA